MRAIGVKLTAPAALGLACSRAGTRSVRRPLAVSDSQRGVGELLGERGRFLRVAAQASQGGGRLCLSDASDHHVVEAILELRELIGGIGRWRGDGHCSRC